MDVLCTDKTGTLTQDRIILKRHLDIRGEDCDRVLEFAYLNSHFQSGLKNLLDIAVLEHAESARACVRARYREDRRNPVRLRAAAPLGRAVARGRHACADLQGRGRGDVRRCTRYELRRRLRRCSTQAISQAARRETDELNARRLPRRRRRLQGAADAAQTALRVADESRSDAARLHRLSRPAQGNARRRHRRAAAGRRRGQDPDRRQ